MAAVAVLILTASAAGAQVREIVTDREGRVISDTKPAPMPRPATTPAPGAAPAGETDGKSPANPDHAAIVETVAEPFEDPFLVEARAATEGFTETLPNFIVEQLTWRSVSETRPAKWKPLDRVEAEVVYDNGMERYQNIRVGGKPLKKGSPEESGTWSAGEFNTIQLGLLHPGTQADFRSRGSTRINAKTAKLYGYNVEQINSRWKITFDGVTIMPAYRGRVWFHTESKRILRIEMEAIQIPEDYPMDKVETAVDYEFVKIGPNQYLLPVKSDVLACQRGSTICSHNEIHFRNYRRFTAESTISTTDSAITFEGGEKPEEPAAPAENPKPKK
jgi:hypothetical protein